MIGSCTNHYAIYNGTDCYYNNIIIKFTLNYSVIITLSLQ